MKKIKNSIGNEALIFAETFEYEAYDQIKKLVNFEPYLNSKVRIMPDAHAGKGCTVGTTMTISDKVTPNLVGVDIGCLDCNTEFLTPHGWKKMDSFDNNYILQYDKDKGSASFVKPVNYIVKGCNYFYHFKNSKGLDQMLSEEHNLLVWKGYKSKGYNLQDMNPNELIKLGNKLNKGYYGFKASFNIESEGLSLCDHEIRLDVMIAADGCIKEQNDSNKIELHFKKTRKIERARFLLKNCGINFIESVVSDKSTYFYFTVPKAFNKDLSKYYMANQNQLKILSEESLLWDGHKGYRSYFSSTDKTNCDVIQFAFSANDVRAGISTIIPTHKNWSDNYIVTPTRNNIVAFSNTINKVKSVDGKKYCFTVPSGYFVARRNGKIFITGNCGMITVSIKDEQIDFKKLDRIIKTKIPHGFNIHKTPKTDFDFSKLRCSKHVDLKRAIHSLGSLGGGNHFIEIGKEEETGQLYLIIHSGSRKLGGDTCKYYQDLAFSNANEMSKIKANLVKKLKTEGREKDIQAELKKIQKPRTDKELAFLSGSDFDDYMNDMAIVQKFAHANREVMADIILKEMGWQENFRIFTTHNYIDFKRMILRKGAVSAEKGELLVIPINMRDGTLFCVGKGNEDWNYSAPHGAGRLMSRRKAKETINLNEFKDSMTEVFSSSVGTATLDEAPQAYKSIDEIKNAITDTADILAVLKPIYNFKSH